MKAGSEIDNASKSQDSEESGLKHHEKKEFAGFKAEQVSASHPKPHMIQYNDSNEDCDFEGFPVEEMLVYKLVAEFKIISRFNLNLVVDRKSALLQTIKDRYPRRCVRKGYKEEELSDEDEYLCKFRDPWNSLAVYSWNALGLQFVFTYALIICLVLAFILKFSGEMIFCTIRS